MSLAYQRVGRSWDTLHSRSNHCSRPAPPTQPNVESSHFKTNQKLKMAPAMNKSRRFQIGSFGRKLACDVTMTHLSSERAGLWELGSAAGLLLGLTATRCHAAARCSGNRRAQRRWKLISASDCLAAPAFGRQTLHLSWPLLHLRFWLYLWSPQAEQALMTSWSRGLGLVSAQTLCGLDLGCHSS